MANLVVQPTLQAQLHMTRRIRCQNLSDGRNYRSSCSSRCWTFWKNRLALMPLLLHSQQKVSLVNASLSWRNSLGEPNLLFKTCTTTGYKSARVSSVHCFAAF